MAPSKSELDAIAQQAEADLNTYQAKTGAGRVEADDEAGVRTMPDQERFPGSEVRVQGEDLSTNASWNKRIPPQEGGDRDDRGRQARGEHYDHNEGLGGPQDKIRAEYAENPGQNDRDVYSIPGIDSRGAEGQSSSKLKQGEDAAIHNVGRNPPGPGGNPYPGSEYYTPEAVPDSISAEGYVPPKSVTEASRETEGL